MLSQEIGGNLVEPAHGMLMFYNLKSRVENGTRKSYHSKVYDIMYRQGSLVLKRGRNRWYQIQESVWFMPLAIHSSSSDKKKDSVIDQKYMARGQRGDVLQLLSANAVMDSFRDIIVEKELYDTATDGAIINFMGVREHGVILLKRMLARDGTIHNISIDQLLEMVMYK